MDEIPSPELIIPLYFLVSSRLKILLGSFQKTREVKLEETHNQAYAKNMRK
jgi:hypothetical protein